MAVRHGYGKIAGTNALVFAYDTGDIDNSFKGAHGQNFAYGPTRNNNGYNLTTYTNGKLIESNGYTEIVNIPGLGLRSVETTEYYNVYSSYGEDGNYNCCPTLFVYAPGGSMTAVWESNTTYTYQIIYRSTSGYTHPNYMYRYEYNSSGTYLTEAGVHTTSQRTHLGDGWYHAWNTFTTQPGAAQGYTGMWHYEYNTRNKVSVAAVSITKGTSVRPPKQFIDEGSIRSATQGLLDLSGRNTIDISAASFNTDGNLTFDGTTDSILVGTVGNYSNNISCEAVFRTTRGSSWNDILCGGCGDIIFTVESNKINFGAQCNSPIPHANYSTTAVSTGSWFHAVATYDGSNVRIYINGILENTYPRSGSFTPSNLRVGSANAGTSEFFQGDLPVVKLYNVALSSIEVANNYRHYKSRFNI